MIINSLQILSSLHAMTEDNPSNTHKCPQKTGLTKAPPSVSLQGTRAEEKKMVSVHLVVSKYEDLCLEYSSS